MSAPDPRELEGLEIVREVGRGGTSVVYEARHKERGVVAVKVLTDEDPVNRAAFEREHALVNKVDHAAIVPIHELIRTRSGGLACVMELVDGSTLEELMERGEAPRSRAVAIVASAARALASVHAAGIVHRDLKPQNILVEKTGRVRILDFGIAKDLGDPAFRDDPEIILGTPSYLSPEQAQVADTTPATDVWGLGIVLYELLVGTLPFERPSLSELIRAIVFDPAPPPRTLNPAVGPGLEAIVLRCLEKNPLVRFQSGAELAQVLESHLSGTPEEALVPIVLARFAPRVDAPATPPEPKPRREDAPIHHRWTWDLEASPEALWPLVSDTERFNQAIGLPAVEWSVTPDGQGDVARIGRFRRLGMTIEWLEHPYEWVGPREQSVLRVYRKGPLQALWSRVQLLPRGAGTTVVHEVWIQPKGPLGRIAAYVEMNLGTRRKIDVVYRSLDRVALAASRIKSPSIARATSWLESKTARLTPAGETRLAAAVPALEKEAAGQPWGSLARPLGAEVRDASDADAGRLRPYALAKRWGARRNQALKVCAAAVRAGVLETSWHLLCPICRVPVGSLPSLASLKRSNHCDTCDIDYENDLARSIELVFRPTEAVRSLAGDKYCPGGPGHYRHVLAQQELDPGEARDVELVVAPGAYRVAVRGIRQAFDLRATTASSMGRVEVDVEDAALRAGPFAVCPGTVTFTLRNASKRRRLVRIEGASWREDPLTALEACGNAEVRDLLTDLAPGEPVQVGQASYLAASIGPGATADATKAFARVFADLAGESGGAVVPREPLFAAFTEEAAAIETALRLHEVTKLPGPLEKAPVRAAVHSGPSVGAAVGGGMSYEGRVPDLTLTLLEECQPGEVATTHLVLGEAHVRELVGTRESRIQVRRTGRDATLAVVYLRA